MSSEEIEVGDVVQVIDRSDKFYGMLFVVSEVKTWGVQAYAKLPQGTMYYLIEFSQLSFIGRVHVKEQSFPPDDLADDMADAAREAKFGKGL